MTSRRVAVPIEPVRHRKEQRAVRAVLQHSSLELVSPILLAMLSIVGRFGGGADLPETDAQRALDTRGDRPQPAVPGFDGTLATRAFDSRG